MKIVRVRPPNHSYRWFYQFRVEGKIRGIGVRLPFTRVDLRWVF